MDAGEQPASMFILSGKQFATEQGRKETASRAI
jgi:hypothetical protein